MGFTSYTTWEQEHGGDTLGEALCDAWNARNAAEIERCAAIGHDCATSPQTVDWVPPTGLIERRDIYRERNGKYTDRGHTAFIGRGDKIRCGHVVRAADEIVGGPAAIARVWAKNSNVCRPFDEAHAAKVAAGHDGKGANPHDTKRTLSEPYEPGDEVHYQLKPENMGFVRHTPPNHGHGARCLCFFYAPNWDLSLVDPEIQGRRRMTAMVLSSGQRVIVHSASTGLVSPQDCEWCAGTGRIICDQDSLGGQREGRVSPSHKAGGYAEWQRRYANLVWGQIEGNRTFQVPLELAHIYATDGEPATTERE